MRTSIDEIVAHLRDLNTITDRQAAIILEFEQRAKTSERSADAKVNVGKMQELDPEKVFIEKVLQQTLNSLLLTLGTYRESASPALHIVSGAPGSGKSTLCHRLLDENCNVVYLCGDIVKRKFQEKLKQASVTSGLSLSVLEKYSDAVYIHRLTSPITWHLFDKAIQLRKSVLLEIIGTDPVSDAQSIIDAIESGYESHLYHVACTQNRAISSAIDRFFSSGSEDSGRYISLTNIANKHEAILTTYRDTITNLHGYNCVSYLYDNSEWAMTEVFRADLLIDKTEPNISRFFSLEKESGLWYRGENHSADLAAFAFDDDGDLCVASASRLKSPFIGMFGLPGGFVYTKAKRGDQYLLNMETPLEAALREFSEKTLFRLAPTATIIPIGVYKGKNRDPRDSIEAAVISNAFAICFDETFPLTPGSDVRHAQWLKVRDIASGKVPLAFDHATIVFDAISKLKLQLTRESMKNVKVEDTVKKGSKILWVNPLTNQVEEGDVVLAQKSCVSVIWLEGYKSRNDDVNRSDILSVWDPKGDLHYIAPFEGHGHLTDAGKKLLQNRPELNKPAKDAHNENDPEPIIVSPEIITKPKP